MRTYPKGRTAEEHREFNRNLVRAVREKMQADLAAGLLRCDCSKTAVVIKHLEPVCETCDGLEAYTNQRILRQTATLKESRMKQVEALGMLPRWVRNSIRIAEAEEALVPFTSVAVDNHPLGVIVTGHGIYPLLNE